MRPYGVRIIECPDVADIQLMGAKSSTGQLRSKSGEYRGYSRRKAKKTIRCYWKRRARHERIEVDE
jgi:hypothetical protein